MTLSKLFDGCKPFLNHALTIGLLLSLAGCGFTYYQSREVAKQSHQIQKLSGFQSSAEKYDAATVSIMDALADGVSLSEARMAYRSARTDHVIRTEADRIVLGEDYADNYMKSLNVLSDTLEESVDARKSKQRVEAFSKVISDRRKMLRSAYDL